MLQQQLLALNFIKIFLKGGNVDLPKSITIGGQKVKVKLQSFNDYDGYTFGQYFHDNKIIQLNPDQSDKNLVITLRHEMMEAALLISGVGFSDNYEQEAVVRCMEEIFFPAWDLLLNRFNF